MTLLTTLRKDKMQALKEKDTIKRKIAIIESYLPQQMTHEEIEAAIQSIITEKHLK